MRCNLRYGTGLGESEAIWDERYATVAEQKTPQGSLLLLGLSPWHPGKAIATRL
jgi:hypothetical protein